MTQEDKNLILKDLFARLLYGVKVCARFNTGNRYTADVTAICVDRDYIETRQNALHPYRGSSVEDIRPYLRPMSSMTEEERDEIEEMSHGWFYVNEDGEIFPVGQLTDSGEFEDAILPTLEWLDKKMFDYRGLIPMGLALEAPEEMYKNE